MGRLKESVSIRHLPATAPDAELAALDRPWIADEGPRTARFARGPVTGPPEMRGLAFDARATVGWDEAGVQVLTAKPPEDAVVAWSSPVLVRGDRFASTPALVRIDYLRGGTLLGSRFCLEEDLAHEGP
jgi:hypothetical protein